MNIKEYNKEYYTNHSKEIKSRTGRYRKENQKKYVEWTYLWKQNNPERCRAYTAKRKAVVLKADDNTLTSKALTVLQQTTTNCPCCGDTMTDKKGPKQKNISHMIPLARGGVHGITNVLITCRTCNLSMNNELLTEWDGIPGDRAEAIYTFLQEVA